MSISACANIQHNHTCAILNIHILNIQDHNYLKIKALTKGAHHVNKAEEIYCSQVLIGVLKHG